MAQRICVAVQRCLWLGLLVLTACEAVRPSDRPRFHTPLARTDWETGVPRKTPGAKNSGHGQGGVAGADDLGERMVTEARMWMERDVPNRGFGGQDLARIFERVGIAIGWTGEQGMSGLVNLAKKKDAYFADGDPFVGDVVLFHNQTDVNSNGQNDDWFTGCGIVVQRDGSAITAVTRTGHSPRQVTIRPEAPSQRIVDGEIVNSFVRVPLRADPSDTLYLAGQLYAGYIRIEKLLD